MRNWFPCMGTWIHNTLALQIIENPGSHTQNERNNFSMQLQSAVPFAMGHGGLGPRLGFAIINDIHNAVLVHLLA